MVEHTLEESHKPPEPTLHPIEEQDTDSPNSASASESSHESHEKKHENSRDSGSPKQQQQKQQKQQKNDTNQPIRRPPMRQHSYLSTPYQEQPPTPLSARAAITRQPTESGSVYYGPQSQRDPSLRNRTHSQQQINRYPSHSLAGSNTGEVPPQQGNVYIDPEYHQYNPKYGGNNEKPVWGLAKPLPRVVRPGMRRDDSRAAKAYDAEPPGSSQPAPELGATPGVSSPQAGNVQGQGQGQSTYSNAAQQGLAKQHAIYAPQPDGMLRPMESEVSQDMPTQKAGARQQEMEQQPSEEFLNKWVKIRHHMKEPFAEWLAVSTNLISKKKQKISNFSTSRPQ